MRYFRTGVGTTVAALAATFLIAPPAQAEAYVHVDGPRDMVAFPNVGRPVAVPRYRNGDFRRVVVRHGLETVTIRAKMARLHRPRGAGSSIGLYGFIKADPPTWPYPDVPYWFWQVRFDQGRPHNPARISILDGVHEESGGCYASNNQSTTGLRAHINYRRDVIVVSIPRRCIANTFGLIDDPEFDGTLPTWVRVSMASDIYRLGTLSPYRDDFIRGRIFNPAGYADRFTPRLYASASP